jgi:very-short-patch-repair endonuclease
MCSSKATSKFLAGLSPDEYEKWKISRTYTRTPETCANAINGMKKARTEKWDEIYGKGSERNKKISIEKLKYWDGNIKAKLILSEQSKSVMARRREEMGEIAYMEMLQRQSRQGFMKTRAGGRSNAVSNFEQRMINILELENIEYVPQFRIERSFYDVYLPTFNVLLEFDGDFYHPLTLDDCKYKFQVNNYHGDINKNELAKNNGYTLIRIRESDKITSIANILSYMKGGI